MRGWVGSWGNFWNKAEPSFTWGLVELGNIGQNWKTQPGRQPNPGQDINLKIFKDVVT